jgi:hypothetical protein
MSLGDVVVPNLCLYAASFARFSAKSFSRTSSVRASDISSCSEGVGNRTRVPAAVREISERA